MASATVMLSGRPAWMSPMVASPYSLRSPRTNGAVDRLGEDEEEEADASRPGRMADGVRSAASPSVCVEPAEQSTRRQSTRPDARAPTSAVRSGAVRSGDDARSAVRSGSAVQRDRGERRRGQDRGPQRAPCAAATRRGTRCAVARCAAATSSGRRCAAARSAGARCAAAAPRRSSDITVDSEEKSSQLRPEPTGSRGTRWW